MAETSSISMDNANIPIPGTQLLVELQNLKANGSLILIPTPSPDPDDPLNWSPRRKALATFCWVLYTLANGIAGSNLYSVLTEFSRATNLAVSTINAGTGYLFLLAGWGLLFWQPFAAQYGKRPTYLLSLCGIIACTVWAPFISSQGQWYARSVLLGFFAAPVEALPELSVADLYFTHERGRYMGLYAGVLVGSNFLAPLIFGFVNQGMGWRWVFWWPVIFCGVAVLVLLFGMEETNFDRILTPESAEKSDIPAVNEIDASQAISYRKKTYFDKLRLKDRPRPFLMLYRCKRQLSFLFWPIPVYAGFAYGSTLIWFNVMNATASVLLSAPPYNFSTQIVGLSYVAPLIGVIVAFFVVGRFSDYLVQSLARRNNGIMEPEQRLWIFAASTVTIPCALILWGVGASHDIHWIGLLVAMAMLGFTNTCGASLSTNYLIDCYRELSGEAMTALIIVRNTMSFAIGYGITPWLDNLGKQNCFISAACIGFAASLSFLLMEKWGKKLRRVKKVRYWQLAKEAEVNGLHR